MERVRQPHAVDRDVARQRIRGRSGSFDESLGMFSGKATDQRHPRYERYIPDPRSDQAIAHIGGQVLVAWAARGLATHRARPLALCCTLCTPALTAATPT